MAIQREGPSHSYNTLASVYSTARVHQVKAVGVAATNAHRATSAPAAFLAEARRLLAGRPATRVSMAADDPAAAATVRDAAEGGGAASGGRGGRGEADAEPVVIGGGGGCGGGGAGREGGARR